MGYFLTRNGLVLSTAESRDPVSSTPLHDAHVLGGRVKSAIREAVPGVQSVLMHMEPYTPNAAR